MNKKTRKFYQMNINSDYHQEGFEFESSFSTSFIIPFKKCSTSTPHSEHYDFKWKYNPSYFKEDSQIDCTNSFVGPLDSE